ncbi:chitin synthase-domain-containing protein [Mortierella sp. GBAus27b]|nr:chitin synthase-domain-containing protein [Mortierella sp. GBAus27b]
MDWIRSFVGRDVSLAVQRRSDHKGIASCLHGYFRVGVLDGQPNGCVASIVINTLTLAILVLITVLRLVSALYYRRIIPKHHANAGKNSPNPAIGADTKGESHVLMLVTCCATDTEDQIKATLDSLAMTDYDDSRKMILVITDATLDTSGESSSEKAERGEVGVEHDTDPFALGGCQPTVSSPEADTTRVHSGHYVVDTRRVPYVLIIRPSKAHDQESPFETWHKKRLVIQWLHRVCFNEPMSAFEFNLLERVRELNHEGPGVFDMLLTTEVGSVCDQRSVGQLVSTLESNNQIMGASGHGLVANRSRNWLTRLQDYENHLYLQFRSAFESSFGAVQCLSNRFGIIRIKIKTRYFVPILIHPDVVSSFVKHKTTTLHERILVLRGGEDRYLTGLLFRTFPRRRIVYRPYAIYQFPVTPNLLVYIREQRLLWISSFHNLWVQIWSSRLRGLFCWSINFLALLEWLNLVLLPMIIVMTVVLLVVVAIGAVTDEGAFYSLPTMLALAFMVSSTILQPILGIFLGRRSMVVDLVGLALFLVTLPFKSLVVSVYAFLGHDGKFGLCARECKDHQRHRMLQNADQACCGMYACRT